MDGFNDYVNDDGEMNQHQKEREGERRMTHALGVAEELEEEGHHLPQVPAQAVAHRAGDRAHRLLPSWWSWVGVGIGVGDGERDECGCAVVMKIVRGG